MKAELTDISAVKKSFQIEIPEDVVREEITTIARQFARRAIPGFRPGKAPLGVVKTRYREDILSEMYQHLLPHYFSDAVREKNLNIVDELPTFQEVDYSSGTPLRFKAVFEVYPTLDITNHADIPVEEIPTEVADEEVDDTLERMAEERAEMTPLEEDRAAQEGDFVEMSFTVSLDGEDERDLSGDKALCEIGGATTVKEFTDNLTGARPGEDREFEVNYSEDHPEAKLAGKTARYKVHVESIKQKKRPALDDEFAESLGKYKTLADLRTDVKQQLEDHKSQSADEQTRDSLLRWLEDNNEFEVPESLVEHQLQVRLQRLTRDLSRQGINPQRLDVDWEKIRTQQYDQAIRDVRGSLILNHLAHRESIGVSDEEIEKEIETMANQMQRPVESVREALNRNEGVDQMKGQIRNNKVLEMLRERANIVPADSLQIGSEIEKPGS